MKELVKALLPNSSEVLNIKNFKDRPAIIVADIDGDMINEILVAYKFQGENYIGVLKYYNGSWYVADAIKGEGYNVTYFDVKSITDDQNRDLVVGWQQGAIWSKLGIYRWEDSGLKKIINEDFIFSKMEVEEINGGTEEIALWVHDTGEAYKVNVYTWNGYELVPAIEVYPYYFKKVAEYYENLVKKYTDYAFYWYYLADAQLKANNPKRALVAINTAISLNKDYPYSQELLELKEEILKSINLRNMNSEYINLYPASIKTVEGTKWGYINDEGSFIIKPNFDYAMDFQENGLAVVQLKNLNGIIDKTGNFIVEPKYESITEFSEGRAAVVNKEGFKVIDEDGKEITIKVYSYIGTYRFGRAVVSNLIGNEYYYGYIDRAGKEIIPITFKNAYDFKRGRAVVQIKDSEFALINTNGERISTYNYAFVGPEGDNGLFAFKKESEGKSGYINVAGNIVIGPKYNVALPFQDGRAVVNISEDYSNQYGLIDAKGNFIIKPEYNDINMMGEGRVSVGEAINEEQPYLGSQYAIADIDGNFLTGFIYSNVMEYNKGVASVSDGKTTFFIDRTGKQVKELPVVQGEGTLTLEGNLIRTNVDMRTFYLDKCGRVVWSQNKYIQLNKEYKVIEEKFKPNKDYIVYYPQLEGIRDIGIQKSVNDKLKILSQVKDIPSDVQLEYSYTGDFSIEFFKKNLLVLELDGYEYYFGAAHGMPTKTYPHIDLITGKFYELKDLFKTDSNYVKVISDIIGEQIKNNEEYSYVFPDAYKGISANQPFYVSEKYLYIYFTPYEIAPYAAGFPTFKIPYSEIMNIINVDGEFWNSFNA
jgi:hypothetical protein